MPYLEFQGWGDGPNETGKGDGFLSLGPKYNKFYVGQSNNAELLLIDARLYM